VCAQSLKTSESLAALVAPFARRRCAQNYLDWFDRLTRERHG